MKLLITLLLVINCVFADTLTVLHIGDITKLNPDKYEVLRIMCFDDSSYIPEAINIDENYTGAVVLEKTMPMFTIHYVFLLDTDDKMITCPVGDYSDERITREYI